MHVTKLVLLHLLEKALSSAGQQFIIACLAGGATLRLAGLPWVFALATAGGAFALSIITSALTVLTGLDNLPYWWEVTRRVVVTFLQSLLATLGAGVVDITKVHWVSALDLAALTAFAALTKCLLAPNAPVSPSLLSPAHITQLKGQPA